jgi:hypothetical protein
MTAANVQDPRLAEALIQRDEQGYFADKAYSEQAQPVICKPSRAALWLVARPVSRSTKRSTS